MRKINLLCLLSGLLFANIVFAASFNCSKASSKVEVMICSDQELSILDDNLNKMYKQTLNTTDDKEYLKSEQIKWIKTRNKCITVDCLKKSYDDRILNLTNYKLGDKDNNSSKIEEKSLNYSKKYAGVKFGDNINNYKEYSYGPNFFDMRGFGASYIYAGFSGHIISSKNDDKIDKINISKSFKNKDEVYDLKNSFDSKYNFIEKTEEARTGIYDRKYKQTTYSYDDQDAVIMLIINDYSNFSEVDYYVTLEYASRNLFNEIKAKNESKKAQEQERLNKNKKEAEGL